MNTRIDESPLRQLPKALQLLLQFERFHSAKRELFWETSADPAFDASYFPHNRGAFRLPCYWIGREHLLVFGDAIEAAQPLPLIRSTGRLDSVLFPIHPTSLPVYRDLLSRVQAEDATEEMRLWAVPTSSTRTLLSWIDERPETALFIKTTLTSPVLGDRHVHLRTAACSVGLSRFITNERGLPDGLRFLPEPLALVPREMRDGGVIFRTLPQDIRDGRLVAAPLLSLLGTERGSEPLLLTIAKANGEPPLELVRRLLCRKFARIWLRFAVDHGVLLEAHGQDLMLLLSPELRTADEFCYRDFEGLQVDWDWRRRRGLRAPEDLPNAANWFETYGTWGYPYAQLGWYKLRISLYDYLHFVLNEVDAILQQSIGVRKGTTTALFSAELNRAVAEAFGTPARAHPDIYADLNGFIRDLLRMRSRLVC